MHRYPKFMLAFLIVILMLVSCNQRKDLQQDTQLIIASAGERVIDWNMLWRSYHLDPKWGKGLTQQASYEYQLEYLLDQKLFAMAAVSEKLDEQPALAGYLEYLREKELIKALYAQEIGDKINITDQEYQQAYRRSKMQVQFDYIMTPIEANADVYLKRLQSFPLNDIHLVSPEKEEKGTSPFYTFGEMAVELEAVVFDLELNEVSGPIKIDHRWMILKLVDGKRDLFMSEIDFAENKNRLKKVFFERRSKVLSDAFVSSLMHGVRIQIQETPFYALAEQFNALVEIQTSDSPFPVYVKNRELKATRRNLADLRDETLVEFSDRQLTVEDFLTRLLNMPAGLRPQVNMAPALRRAILETVRDQFLLAEAHERGFESDKKVLRDIAIQSDEILARKWLQRLRDQIVISQEEIENFRDSKNYRQLQAKGIKKMDNSEIEKLLQDHQFLQLRQAQADSLRTIYPVKVNQTTLLSRIDEPETILTENPVSFFYREKIGQ